MKITINLDSHSVITQPTSVRVKAGGFVPIDVVFMRENQAVALPNSTPIEFVLKPQNKWTGSVLVYHENFVMGEGNVYSGIANFSTAELLGAIGVNDNVPENDTAKLDCSAEIVWEIDDKKFRSATFSVVVDTPIADAVIIPPTEVGNYPLAEYVETTIRKGQANGYAGLDAEGKVPLAQLPALGARVRETENRLTANHTGWGVGDIVVQGKAATPLVFQLEVLQPLPPPAYEVIEFTAMAVPDGVPSNFELNSDQLGGTDIIETLGPLTAAEHAGLIKAAIDAAAMGTTSISGNVVTLTSIQGRSLTTISGSYATMEVTAQGDMTDYEGLIASTSWFAFSPMTKGELAQTIYDALSENPSFNVSLNGNIVTATSKTLGPADSPTLDGTFNIYVQTLGLTVTNGTEAIAPSVFLVTDPSNLDDASGYTKLSE